MTNVINLASISALRTFSGGSSDPAIWIDGYSNTADGGEGKFVYVSSDTTSPDNGGTIIIDGTGTNRYYRAYNKTPLNILWFGALNNGTGDCTTALTKALAAFSTGKISIYFPPGVYNFNSAISYSMSSSIKPFSMSLFGAGQDVTTLTWPSTNGIAITCNDPSHTVHLRDMSLTTGGAGSYTAITVSQTVPLNTTSLSDFTNLTLAGSNRVTDYWSIGIANSALSFVNYNGVIGYGIDAESGGTPLGTLFSIAGITSGSANYLIAVNFSSCTSNYLGYGLVIGSYVQGVTVSQCNFNSEVASGKNGVGIHVPASESGALVELLIANCQFGCGGNQILIETSLSNFQMTNNLVFVTQNFSGVSVTSAGQVQYCTFTGNTFMFGGSSSVGSTGINIASTSPAQSNVGIITCNVFSGLGAGVELSAATHFWNVQANEYPNCATTVINNGGSGNSIGVATS